MSCILAPITFNFILLCLQLYCTYEGGRERIESEGEGKGEKQRGKERVSCIYKKCPCICGCECKD